MPGTLKVKVGGVSVPVPFLAMPPGVVTGFAGDTAPAGWLLCQGQSLLRADYPSLFAVIGTTYGSVDATHFNLPDLRVRVPVGVGTGKALGDSDGLAEGARNAKWSHSHAHTGSAVTTISGGISGAATGISTQSANTDHNHTTGDYTHTTGTNTGTGGTAQRLISNATHGHGSTSLAVQAGGQNHAHGINDPWHAHGHTIAAATTVAVDAGDSGSHPTLALNYIIKE